MKKSIFAIFLAFSFTFSDACGQSSGNNYSYIRTRTFTKADGTSSLDRLQYDNGLGDLHQEVAVGITPQRKSLVVLHEYDIHRRPLHTWLPALTDGDAAVADTAVLKASSRLLAGGDSCPYSTTLSEGFPATSKKQFGAGAAWRTADKSIRISEGTNVAGQDSKYSIQGFRIIYGDDLFSAGFTGGRYLYTETVDEDGGCLIEFHDEEGHLLLSRRVDGNKFFSTYYVYDDAGRLCYVFPPELEETLKQYPGYIATDNNELILRYATCYRYDGRGNCTYKKLPGTEHVEYVYDNADRLIFSQDGNQRASATGNWTYYVYDKFNRLTEQGVCTDKVTASGTTVHLRNYYDNYSFVGTAGFTNSNFTSDTSGRTKSLLTGQMIAGTGAGGTVYKAFYYDDLGREVKRVGSNALSGYDITATTYSFTNRPLAVTHTHNTGTKSLTETITYTYDHADRLSKVQHKLDNGATVTLAEYVYDTLGRIQSKKLGGTAHTATYAYNVRGWLTGITGGKLTQNLYYNTGTGTPRYNGNISSMTWKAGSESTVRGYKFTYDGLDRLTNAVYGETSSISSNINRFSENVTGYDKNGNITALQRYGQTSASAYGLVDNLTFTLSGNRLNRVDDAVTASTYNGGFEFKDAVKQADEYAYDANGNLTKDLNKNITGIQYNFLNLPSLVTFADGSTIAYLYAADGTKLRTVHTIGSTTTTTDYCGNVVYENGVAKLLLTEAGYITLSDKKYHYYLQDHQGNNRVVIDQNGSVEETNHYYPFGGVFASSGNVQPYKYNGKEFDVKKGLNWYDYGARRYDTALGRFTTVDPLAEKYYSTNPFTYCLNNPMKFIDPTGQLVSPIYDRNGILLGTDDEGLKGNAIIMNKSNFKQGMAHEEALSYSLGYEGLIDDEARSNYTTSYTGLKDRPDYDGFVTIDEGVKWAKKHPNALTNPTPENSLYINTALLDFGDLTVDKIGIRNTGKIMPVNLFTKSNTKESIVNERLRATVYALGTVDVILHNPVMRTISIVNNNATDYDWNGGGSFIRNAAIQLELIRSGLSNTHGFKTYYYGIGRLRK